MKRSRIILAYLLNVISVLLYILIPSTITFNKAFEFIFAVITPVVAAAALALFVVSCKKLNFSKEHLPLYVPSIVIMVSAVAVMLIRLFYAFYLGFVPELGTGFFRNAGAVLTAFAFFTVVGTLYVHFMKTENN